MTDKVLAVFTSRTIERMCAEGGSQAWTFSAVNARTCHWLICVWNARGAYAESGAAHLAHREAFLIAPIDSIDPSPQEPERWIARFHEYARISIPNAWNGQRLPFRYLTLGDFGIAPENLRFVPTGPVVNGGAAVPSVRPTVMPISIESAKLGLAATFNVPPEAIEITIRG
jgi:hypothetical protein